MFQLLVIYFWNLKNIADIIAAWIFTICLLCYARYSIKETQALVGLSTCIFGSTLLSTSCSFLPDAIIVSLYVDVFDVDCLRSMDGISKREHLCHEDIRRWVGSLTANNQYNPRKEDDILRTCQQNGWLQTTMQSLAQKSFWGKIKKTLEEKMAAQHKSWLCKYWTRPNFSYRIRTRSMLRLSRLLLASPLHWKRKRYVDDKAQLLSLVF